jgi:hypothetical protein
MHSIPDIISSVKGWWVLGGRVSRNSLRVCGQVWFYVGVGVLVGIAGNEAGKIGVWMTVPSTR